MPTTTTPTTTVFHGSAANPITADRADFLLALTNMDTCVSCGGPGAIRGYFTCVPCLEAE
jgi:hypothetical protein